MMTQILGVFYPFCKSLIPVPASTMNLILFAKNSPPLFLSLLSTRGPRGVFVFAHWKSNTDNTFTLSGLPEADFLCHLHPASIPSCFYSHVIFLSYRSP